MSGDGRTETGSLLYTAAFDRGHNICLSMALGPLSVSFRLDLGVSPECFTPVPSAVKRGAERRLFLWCLPALNFYDAIF